MKYTELGNNIKKARKKYGLTQKELGRLIFKSEVTIRKYESGSYRIPIEVLLNLCKILNIDLNTLLGNDYAKYSEEFNNTIGKINSTLDKVNIEIKKFEKHRQLLDSGVSITNYENNPLKEKDIKELLKSTVIDILYLALESDELTYNVDSFSQKEIDEIIDFLYNAYTLKIKEILERHNSKDNDK